MVMFFPLQLKIQNHERMSLNKRGWDAADDNEDDERVREFRVLGFLGFFTALCL
jgi:hypothetical protein